MRRRRAPSPVAGRIRSRLPSGSGTTSRGEAQLRTASRLAPSGAPRARRAPGGRRGTSRAFDRRPPACTRLGTRPRRRAPRRLGAAPGREPEAPPDSPCRPARAARAWAAARSSTPSTSDPGGGSRSGRWCRSDPAGSRATCRAPSEQAARRRSGDCRGAPRRSPPASPSFRSPLAASGRRGSSPPTSIVSAAGSSSPSDWVSSQFDPLYSSSVVARQ